MQIGVIIVKKVIIVKEVISCDVLPVAMFLIILTILYIFHFCFHFLKMFDKNVQV